MKAIAIPVKLSWPQRLLAMFCAFTCGALLLLRLWVNPSFALNYLLMDSRGYIDDQILSIPTLVTWLSIAKLSRNSSKAQIHSLLGPPRLKESHLCFPGCSAATRSADEIWFYEVAPWGLLVLRFKGERCFMAGSFEGREGIDYAKWKAKQIREKGTGQTRAELESWLGHCFTDPEELKLFFKLTGRKNDTESSFVDMPGHFYVGSGCVVSIQMHNGRCVGAQDYAVFY